MSRATTYIAIHAKIFSNDSIYNYCMVPCGTECGIDDILIFSYTLTFMLGTTLSRHILML